MSGENSCFSRFLVKFVEVSAAGLATAISAYALAHLGGFLSSSPTPPSAPATAVQVSPIANEAAEGLRAKPTPPAAAAAVNKQSPAPQQDTDATVAQPARKAAKDAKALPPRKHTKTDKSVAEKQPRGGQTSAEDLARAALANVDANQPAPSDAPIEPGLADARSAPVDMPVDIQPRRTDVPPRQADVGAPPPIIAVPSSAPGVEAAPHALDIQSPPVVQSSPVAPVDLQPRPVVGVEAPPRTSEIPRPPMPVGTASPEIK